MGGGAVVEERLGIVAEEEKEGGIVDAGYCS